MASKCASSEVSVLQVDDRPTQDVVFGVSGWQAESEGSGVAKAAEVAVQLLGTICADLLAEPYMQWQLTQQVD